MNSHTYTFLKAKAIDKQHKWFIEQQKTCFFFSSSTFSFSQYKILEICHPRSIVMIIFLPFFLSARNFLKFYVPLVIQIEKEVNEIWFIVVFFSFLSCFPFMETSFFVLHDMWETSWSYNMRHISIQKKRIENNRRFSRDVICFHIAGNKTCYWWS